MANLNNGLTADQAVVLTTALVDEVRDLLAAMDANPTAAASTFTVTGVKAAMNELLQVDEYA